jgi:hypothetical protein
MGRANDFKRKRVNPSLVAEGIDVKSAVRRLLGAAGTVAIKQDTLRLNVDDMTAKTAKATEEKLVEEGFTVTRERDKKDKKRWWFEMDWSDPPSDEPS